MNKNKWLQILQLIVVSISASVAFGSSCYDVAIKTSAGGFLSSHPVYATQLCGRSQSVAPVDCYFMAINTSRKSNNGFLYSNKTQAVSLCRLASSIAPSTCYFEALKRSNGGYLATNKSEAVNLCAKAQDNSPVNCYFNRVKSGRSSYAAAVQFCSNN